MSQHRAADHRPPESQLWRPESSSGRGAEQQGAEQPAVDKHVAKKSGVSEPRADGRSAANHRQKRLLERRSVDERRSADGGHGANTRRGVSERRSLNAPVRAGGGPLTAFGVSIVLAGACLIGASLDLLLVNTAAWGLTGLFLAACAYTAAKVRRSDWYSAVVGPPLAFACGLLLVAAFSPHDIGSGLTGTLATILELLAYKARAVFFGTALALCVTLARKLPFPQS